MMLLLISFSKALNLLVAGGALGSKVLDKLSSFVVMVIDTTVLPLLNISTSLTTKSDLVIISIGCLPSISSLRALLVSDVLSSGGVYGSLLLLIDIKAFLGSLLKSLTRFRIKSFLGLGLSKSLIYVLA